MPSLLAAEVEGHAAHGLRSAHVPPPIGDAQVVARRCRVSVSRLLRCGIEHVAQPVAEQVEGEADAAGWRGRGR